MPKKILVLVLSTNMKPWRNIEILGQDATWKKRQIPNVQVMRYFSSHKKNLLTLKAIVYWRIEAKILYRFPGNPISRAWKNYIESIPVEVEMGTDHISLNLAESYSLIGLKTIKTFKTILKISNFDYVYRTNVSSYVDLNLLSEFVEKLEDEELNYFGGVIGEHRGQKFASGSGYLIGKNTLRKAVESSNQWDHSLIDDVALSKLLIQEHGITPAQISRRDFKSIIEAENALLVKNNNFHYRCKVKNYKTTIKIMHAIEKKLALHA
jgi:hypothetical protein